MDEPRVIRELSGGIGNDVEPSTPDFVHRRRADSLRGLVQPVGCWKGLTHLARGIARRRRVPEGNPRRVERRLSGFSRRFSTLLPPMRCMFPTVVPTTCVPSLFLPFTIRWKHCTPSPLEAPLAFSSVPLAPDAGRQVQLKADAGSRRLHAVVRLGAPPRLAADTAGCSP